ncbi:MAG: UDP-N-acetylmuramoyl-L-alanine--D-glutamate ligase [Comamonadaceae bacterium]|nr:UDP-N-acetylmuramoyl-L-alanine--D-glutamate ligase [Comamonadaceae bacterium]
MKQSTAPLVLILGLGISGLAMARWCAAQGMRVRVADTRAQPPHWANLREEVPEVECVLGQPLDAALLRSRVGHVEVSAVYCSPGLALAEVEPVRTAAAHSGVFFGGELDLFSQMLARLRQEHGYRPHVLAITGTNGKTTVTSLTGQLLERAGLSVAVAGNIGPSLLDTLASRMQAAQSVCEVASAHVESAVQEKSAASGGEAGVEQEDDEGLHANCSNVVVVAEHVQPDAYALALPQVWVLELSSFQLEYSSRFEPTAATVLNVSEDHLDWHGSMQAYVRAKARIYGQRAVAVFNRDDAATMALMPELVAATDKPAKGRHRAVGTGRAILRFGLGAPEQAGDWGVEVQAGMPWLVRAYSDAPGEQGGVGAAKSMARMTEVFFQRLMPCAALRIHGRHNISNALAALALASTTGASLAHMLHGLREYRGEPHRVQSLGFVQEVEYIDDSKGTNVGATVAALGGLSKEGSARRLVVILGGDGKGQDFAPLAWPVMQAARAVLLIGRDAFLIETALQGTGVPLHHAPTLEDAVQHAASLAQPGDAVLLSPACASLDMFRDYAHRAEVFSSCVRALALDAGQELGDGT